VTFEGHAASNRRAASSRVWCLDPANGSVRWNVDLDQIADREDLAGLFPVGTPLLLADTVVVAARKPTQRLEQVDWMIGLSRDDGSLRWATTIAGAPGGRGIYGRKQAGIRADGDAVAVSTPLGAIAPGLEALVLSSGGGGNGVGGVVANIGAGAPLAWQAQDLNPAGAVGDASRATAAQGEEILDFAAARMSELWQQVAAFDVDGWLSNEPNPDA
jgi:outer membrane protein assembly factor BamB